MCRHCGEDQGLFYNSDDDMDTIEDDMDMNEDDMGINSLCNQTASSVSHRQRMQEPKGVRRSRA